MKESEYRIPGASVTVHGSHFADQIPSPGGLKAQVDELERRLQLEHIARVDAEAVAKRGLNDLYESQRKLDLLQRVATAANQSGSVDEALRFAIHDICQFTGWDIGHAWRRAAEGEHLVPTGIWWARDPESVKRFMDLSAEMSLAIGEGLPGQVLADGAAHWIVDLSCDPNFLRAPVAERCGLRSAFAFPVKAGTEVAAVIEFFASEHLHRDDALLQLFDQIGTQLGRVIERKRAEEKLVYEALHDPLTGLPNRALFTQSTRMALRRCRRDPDSLFGILFLDLDGFKLVNDGLGHAAGDQLLIECGERLRSTLVEAERFAATVGRQWPRWVLARLGGDEFTILLESMESLEQANEIAGELHKALEAPYVFDAQEVFVGSSIGIAHGGPHYLDVTDIMRDADLAMYEAKAEGRGRTAIFDQAMHHRADVRLQLENDLRRAVSREQFLLEYQPIVRLSDTALLGFEALLRWRRDDQAAPLQPDDFIHVAEETGMIVPIGNWVLQEACAMMAKWQHGIGNRTPAIKMSVNISPKQFLQPTFLAQVRSALDRSGIEPGTLQLEITEGVAVMDPRRTAAQLEMLRRWGVRISIDDFGTGYSSLAYLHKLPFDTLKIDRAFVVQMDGDPAMQVIVKAVLDIAAFLEREVIVEGVETEEERRQLIALGCTAGQGFYFGRPMDVGTVERLLERRRRPRDPIADAA